jgi:hypothetical protein
VSVYLDICKKAEKEETSYKHGAFGKCEVYVDRVTSTYDVYRETVLESLNILN